MPTVLNLGEIGWAADSLLHGGPYPNIFLRPFDPTFLISQASVPPIHYLSALALERYKRSVTELGESAEAEEAIPELSKSFSAMRQAFAQLYRGQLLVNRETREIWWYDRNLLLEQVSQEYLESLYHPNAWALFARLDQYRELQTIAWRQENLQFGFAMPMATVNPNEFLLTLTRRMAEWWSIILQLAETT